MLRTSNVVQRRLRFDRDEPSRPLREVEAIGGRRGRAAVRQR
jgi:hypothetical protein